MFHFLCHLSSSGKSAVNGDIMIRSPFSSWFSSSSTLDLTYVSECQKCDEPLTIHFKR